MSRPPEDPFELFLTERRAELEKILDPGVARPGVDRLALVACEFLRFMLEHHKAGK